MKSPINAYYIPALRSPSVPGRLGSAQKDTSAAEEENGSGLRKR